jgi:putative flavoprotein involved in K+ transport
MTAACACPPNQGEFPARNVVLATGPYQRPLVPEQHTALPTTVAHITANRYSNPRALADGGVLIVGSGASGSQIAEDLVEAGRRVYLSVGRHRRFPRSHRDRVFCWWGSAWDGSRRSPGGSPKTTSRRW